MMEYDILKYIISDMPLTQEEGNIVKECIPVKTYKKGTILLEAGQVSTECYFVMSGCVRHYYITEEGEEKTTFFYTEEGSVASLTSYMNQTPADHYFACLEDCVLAVLGYEKEKELYQRFPRFESLCRVGMEKNFGAHQEMLAKFITQSPEQRYLNLLQTRPDLMNRVPQHQLASYLGVKPESLSRIRKRIALKNQ